MFKKNFNFCHFLYEDQWHFFYKKVGGDKIGGVCAIKFKLYPSVQKSPCLQKVIKNF